MSNRFIIQSRHAILGICAATTLVGFNACTDSYDLDEKGNNPEWLGKSIYEELQNPEGTALQGTFNTYLKLIDDLGYKEVMQKTGSKTVFVANDEAYDKFFASNSWGVHSYNELTTSMKKQLFYASILDNAIQTEMLSNIESTGGVLSRGIAMKHQTSANATDTLYHIWTSDIANLPSNNEYWQSHLAEGLDVVMDNTRPMMVHFTQEQMLNNSITDNDFSIITGRQFSSGSTFIFKNQVIAKDITCLNGYVNQTDGVIVPPGNLGQVIRQSNDTQLFSRMLERFSAPYYDAQTTLNYKDLYPETHVDSIFQWRYFSERSQGATALDRDPKQVALASDMLLTFDPGWNQYYSTYGTSLADMGAIFVPTDEAITDYFTNPTKGGYKILALYTDNPGSAEDLKKNLDKIPTNIIRSFVNNLMNASFVQSVPSKFGTIMDEASDPIGITTDDIVDGSDGAKDVRIANNGAIYMLNRVIPPISYNIVSTPALLRKERDLGVINWAIQDKDNLKVNFYAYLRASTANYALFLPNNEAFCGGFAGLNDFYYVDPVSLGANYTEGPRVLHFFYKDVTKDKNISVSAFKYNPANGSISADSTTVTLGNVTDRLTDILNYHTVSLDQGTTFGTNRYYKTKHGGEIEFTGNTVKSGAQINGMLGKDYVMPASEIKETTTDYSNGYTYVINRVIQAPQTSVYGCLKNNSQFSKFLDLCMPEDLTSLLKKIGISDDEQKMFTVFTNQFANTTAANKNYDCLDYNVAFFNTYNYTLYAPDNDAMDIAFSRGLPTWAEVKAILDGGPTDSSGEPAEETKAKAKAMVEAIRNFIRYHFQDFALYADNSIDFGDAPQNENGTYRYPTSCVNGTIYQRLNVNGGSNELHVTDNAGKTVTIKANDSAHLTNFMARDYIFLSGSINTSSFAAIHEIAEPLCINGSNRYDDAFKSNTEAAKQARLKSLKALYNAQKHGQKYYK